MNFVGYACIAVAVLWLLLKVRLAYQSEGGRMVVTVYDAALYPPLLIVVGLYFILGSQEIHWAIWVAAVPVLIGVCAGIIKLAEEFGDRQL